MNRYTQLSHAPTPAVHGLSPRHFPPHQRERGTINTKKQWKLEMILSPIHVDFSAVLPFSLSFLHPALHAI
jgi:hypothetical protein